MEKDYRIRIDHVDSFSPELICDLIRNYLEQQTGFKYKVEVSLLKSSQLKKII